MSPVDINTSGVGVIVNVTGPDKFEARWRDAGSRIRRGAAAMLMELGGRLADAASANAPRGKTGRLSRSYMVAARTGTWGRGADIERVIVRPKTSKRFVYPIPVEFGSQNPSTPVRQHMRKVRSFRAMRVKGNRKSTIAGETQVRAYSRRLTMKSQHTFGDTFAQMEGQLQEAITSGLAVMAKRTMEGT